MKELTQKRLKELLHYSPETGVFTWLVNRKGTASAGVIAGYLNKKGYIRISVDGERYLAHRLAWLYMTGEWPIQTDHDKGNRADNRFSTLCSVNSETNNKNRKIPSNNTSNVIGVYWHKKLEKWYAAIGVSNRLKSLGYFIDKFEAICCRKSAENKYGYHENHGRTT